MLRQSLSAILKDPQGLKPDSPDFMESCISVTRSLVTHMTQMQVVQLICESFEKAEIE